MKKLIILLFLLPLKLSAQPSDFGNWLIYFGNKQLSQKFNWHHEVQYRSFNHFGDTEQLLLRTGIGFNLTENNNNLLLGYGYIYSEPYLHPTDEKITINEHRIFLQYITKQTFGRLSFSHRYRFEKRFIEDQFKLRLRYFLSCNIALNHKEMSDKTIYFSMYNEIFMNTSQTIFDRNRLYGGIGYRFSKLFRAEIGVMNQASTSSSRTQLNLITFFSF